MIYYYGGKFDPWTNGHETVLNGLCLRLKEGIFDWKDGDQILIGFLDANLPGSIRFGSNDPKFSNHFRKVMIEKRLDLNFRKTYPNLSFDLVVQNNFSTYEFLKSHFGDKYGFEDLKSSVTLVLGEDEFKDLESSVEGNPVKWKYADELLHFSRYVHNRKSSDVSSTKVREILHNNPYVSFSELSSLIAKSTFDLIKSHHYYWQYGYEDTYRRNENMALMGYSMERFPRPSATVDMMVLKTSEDSCSDEILLIRRGNFPYKGFWALPGGFLDINNDLTLEEAASRELLEETSIDFKFGRNNQFRTYSDMGTDPRGRIVDTVFVARGSEWYPVSGDDACEVCWFNINDLPRMAFNHRQIIEDYLSDTKQVQS